MVSLRANLLLQGTSLVFYTNIQNFSCSGYFMCLGGKEPGDDNNKVILYKWMGFSFWYSIRFKYIYICLFVVESSDFEIQMTCAIVWLP